jgi:hypothetical protein
MNLCHRMVNCRYMQRTSIHRICYATELSFAKYVLGLNKKHWQHSCRLRRMLPKTKEPLQGKWFRTVEEFMPPADLGQG